MKTRVVPAIDLLDGKCVRLKQGAFADTEIVGDDPLGVARHFQEQGYGRLHLVDLNGAKAGRPCHLHILREIASSTSLEIDFSGGLRTRENISEALDAGARQVIVGSAAATSRAETTAWFEHFGGDALIIGLDVLDGTVRVSGWQEKTKLSLNDVIDRYTACGLRTVMSTDIAKDGMMSGPSFDLYQSLRKTYPSLRLIASGGVTSAADVEKLATLEVAEVIIGKALYAGAISARTIQEYVW